VEFDAYLDGAAEVICIRK